MKFPARYRVLCAVLVFAGCKKAQAPAPAVQQTLPASKPAPSVTHLTIDGEEMAFPGTELRVRSAGSGVAAELSSVELPGAAGQNDLRFDMDFPDLADASELDGAEWHYVMPAEPTEDTLDAIELHQRSVMLEPVDVKAVVRWGGEGPAVIELTGTFKWFDPPQALDPVKTVTVAGKIEATMRQGK